MTELSEWMTILNAELGTDVSPEIVSAVLELARDAAHNVVRRAAPLSAYLAGYAAGVARAEAFELETAIAILQRAARLAAKR
ncbi:DUF6457 domain-containing protein [Leifsonia sp. fls2-241-R2A-40a]|uniref:DUF6457 domain-containing protein n=1 Tax=Leifsonia sp. fls2-241-R2A-40a TaxID=3040290 RepID=UPI00254D8BDA|nr:DUF6457 domain-containing protein [Leifsonia sp. fls2-241-R2A-40a]